MTLKLPEGTTQLDCSNMMLPKLEKAAYAYAKPGSFVSIRPASDDKTYLGIYLGDMPVGIAGVQKKGEADTVYLVRTQGNPCIFVPELEQVFYGMESWWGAIKKPEDLHKISDADIENVWYVRALKALTEKETVQ